METFTTVNREFVEKCLIALREVPAPLVEAIVHKKKVKITVDYDPKKQFIKTTFTEEAGQDRPATPQPKMGRWIYGEDNLGRDGWYCNQCGHFEFWDYSLDMKSAKLNLPNPCPNCEAKMVEPQEE
jgi:hypothetical protein